MKKVLVVDDDPRLAELIADFCQEAGFETRTCTDSTQAFEMARTWQPQLVTLDLEMPGMDGVEVLRKLQSDKQTMIIPVVIISVVAKGALENGLLKGAQMVFEKPLSLQRFLGRLQELVLGPDSGSPMKAESPKLEPYRRVTA